MMRLNGQPEEKRHETLLALLAEQGISPEVRGIAVALNGTVVPRSRWAETLLADGDDIEIVKIMQGG